MIEMCAILHTDCFFIFVMLGTISDSMVGGSVHILLSQLHSEKISHKIYESATENYPSHRRLTLLCQDPLHLNHFHGACLSAESQLGVHHLLLLMTSFQLLFCSRLEKITMKPSSKKRNTTNEQMVLDVCWVLGAVQAQNRP